MVEFLLVINIEEKETFRGAAELDWQEVGVLGKILANLELEVQGLSDVDGDPGSDKWIGGEDKFVHVVRDGVEFLSCFFFPGAWFLDSEKVCFSLCSNLENRLVGFLFPGSIVLYDCDFSPLLVGFSVQDVVRVLWLCCH